MKFLTAFAVLLLFFSWGAEAEAAYSFVYSGSATTYTGEVDGPEVQTRTSPSYRTIDWLGFSWGTTGNKTVCEEMAAAEGLPEDSQIWCLQQDIPNENSSNCVYLCQGGQGGQVNPSGPSTTITTGSVTSYLYTVEPTFYTTAFGTPDTGDCGNDNRGEICIIWKNGSGEETPPPTATLTAAPPNIVQGGSSELLAYCTNSTFASITPTVGIVPLTQVSTEASWAKATVSPAATTEYELECIGHGGSAKAKATVFVGSTNPDLIGTLINIVSSAPVNQSVTFYPGATNIGTVSTAYGFNNLLQIDSDTSHTIVTATRVVASPVLAPSASSNPSATYTFPTSGTWYVRACADSNASMVGNIVETNENNNCGAWSPIIVGTGDEEDPDGGAAVSCNVSDTNVAIGEPVKYTAIPSGGAGAPYSWTDTPDAGVNLGTSNTVTRTYTANGTYAMQVAASGAASAGFCSNVVVGPAAGCPGTPSSSISAAPNRVRTGNTSTVTWSAQNVEGNCTISGPGLSQTVAASSCSVPSTSATVTINAQSVYTISCTGTNASTVVNLLPIVEEF